MITPPGSPGGGDTWGVRHPPPPLPATRGATFDYRDTSAIKNTSARGSVGRCFLNFLKMRAKLVGLRFLELQKRAKAVGPRFIEIKNARKRSVGFLKEEACTSERPFLSQQPGSCTSPYMCPACT